MRYNSSVTSTNNDGTTAQAKLVIDADSLEVVQADLCEYERRLRDLARFGRLRRSLQGLGTRAKSMFSLFMPHWLGKSLLAAELAAAEGETL
jgi:hypothetical protein